MRFKAEKKIALEEHFAIEQTVQDSAGFVPQSYWEELKSRLLDLHERRIREMDENGIELMILSLNAPTVQAIPDTNAAYELSRRANDYLAEQIARRPDRFKGFAALPMQSPELAARELERCVTELSFVGALVNGFSQSENGGILYYDLPQFRPFWATVERLDVPFYLHPRNPLPAHAPIYDGHPWLLGPTWAFGQETAVHALRLMGSGLFDDYPDLKIILGHMGRAFPTACGGSTTGTRGLRRRRTIRQRSESPITFTLTSGSQRPATSARKRSSMQCLRSARIAFCFQQTGPSKTSITPPSGSIQRPLATTTASRSAGRMPHGFSGSKFKQTASSRLVHTDDTRRIVRCTGVTLE